jgi:hexosaminidase
MDAILAKHPELVAAQNTYPGMQLDYTKDAARALAHDLIEENITLFPGRYFHLGSDEFDPYFDAAWQYAQVKYGGNPNIGGKDVAIAFVNELATIVAAHGKTPRMWSDVVVPKGDVEVLDAKIIPEHWVNRGAKVGDWIGAGFSLLDCNMACTYSTDAATLLSDACAPTTFADGTTLPPGSTSSRGLKYHVWCDPAPAFCPDGGTVAGNVRVPLRALAEVAWGTPRLFATASDLTALADAIGRAPGFVF